MAIEWHNIIIIIIIIEIEIENDACAAYHLIGRQLVCILILIDISRFARSRKQATKKVRHGEIRIS